jgi:membrane-associated protease RseP (regulator of RpoE activity)
MLPVLQRGRGAGLIRPLLAMLLLLIPALCLGADPPQPEQPVPFPNPADLQDLLNRMMQLQQKQMEQQLEQLRKMQAAQFPGGFPGFGSSSGPARAETRLGAIVETPIEALIEQLDLPRGQGQVVTQVMIGSAAAKAGILPSDILLELNGKSVASDRSQFLKAVEDLQTNTPMNLLVLRKGAKKELKGLTLPEMPAPPAAAGPGAPGGAGAQLPPLPGIGFGPRGPANPFGLRGAMNPFGNGTFNGSSQDGELAINVEGTIINGTVTVTRITILDAGKTLELNSLDQVPERYRDKVRGVIERTTKGRAGAAANP